MATGTGKTITALLSIEYLYHHCKNRLGVVILCPYTHLVKQWWHEVLQFGIEPIIGYGDSRLGDFSRYLESKVRLYNKGKKNYFVFITTNQSFKRADIQYILGMVSENLLLVSDEAHTMGAIDNQRYLTDIFDYRLALSATFERYWDREGTVKLYQYFGKTVFSYTLEEAIANGVLVPYQYHPVICYLSAEEYERYGELSVMLRDHLICVDGEVQPTEYGKMLLIERARVVAAAYDKIRKLMEQMEPYRDSHSMLVYCGAANIFGSEMRQLDHVTNCLRNEKQMKVEMFTCEESTEERGLLLQQLDDHSIQALTAIRCLDEGVNVPSIQTAFILASSTNPKEYIQRRGRVLRRSPGKEYAVIYDFVTLPYQENRIPEDVFFGNSQYDLSLVHKELTRILEFGRLAMNREEVHEKMEQIMRLFHIEEIKEDNDGEYSGKDI